MKEGGGRYGKAWGEGGRGGGRLVGGRERKEGGRDSME